MVKRTILVSAITGLLASGGAAVASTGGATSAEGDDERPLSRPVIMSGTCKGGASYQATMENYTFTDESGTQPSVYVTVVVRRAGANKKWGAYGSETRQGSDEQNDFLYMPFRSGRNGVITFETNIPGSGWHRYELSARRLDGSQRCRLSLRA